MSRFKTNGQLIYFIVEVKNNPVFQVWGLGHRNEKNNLQHYCSREHAAKLDELWGKILLDTVNSKVWVPIKQFYKTTLGQRR